MKFLFSGFEAFGGMDYNPSADAVLLLPDYAFGAEICKIILPVEFIRAAELLLSTAESIEADCVICVGYASKRDAVTPELFAKNTRHCTRADNVGTVYGGEEIISGGDARLSSTLPCEKIVEMCTAHGIPARLSEDCGTYVCNDLFYNLMAKGRGIRGFIHVSDLTTEQNKSALLYAVEIIMGENK